MNLPVHRSLLALALVATAGSFASCSDADLYSLARPPIEADRVAVSGRVCSEDPVQAQYPVRVVLLVDQAGGPLYSDFDPQGERVNVLQAFIQSVLSNPETAVAIVRYGGTAKKLAPLEGNFTRNPGEMIAAAVTLLTPTSCIGDSDKCRDYSDGLRTARSLIEGDMASLPAGTRVLTQYVIIHINAGPHRPMALAAECCEPDDVACLSAGDVPSPACQAQQDSEQITAIREAVAAQGAAGLKYHAFHLAAEPDDTVNQQVGSTMKQMAFAGAGRYLRFGSINQFTPDQLDVLDLRTVLRVKHLVVSNLNAKPSSSGPLLDSDGDGLSDAEEDLIGTSPTNWDTDGDDLGDMVETLMGFDPFTPDLPKACENLNTSRDSDRDGLRDCEEELLGTDASLVDSDGDALPDRLELVSATDYLHRDAEGDADGDGISNGDEIRNHTDPRSTDSAAHLSFSYRYEVFDEGVVTELVPDPLVELTGVRIDELSGGTTAGVGTLRWSATQRALSWQDATDPIAGPLVVVGDGGIVELPSSSYAPIQGDEGKRIFVDVDAINLPPGDVTETLRIVFRKRQCLQYTVRNIRLMPARALDGDDERGWNNIVVYFAQAPEDRIDIPGPFRLALVPIQFVPPSFREPGEAIIPLFDEEFVRSQVVVGP